MIRTYENTNKWVILGVVNSARLGSVRLGGALTLRADSVRLGSVSLFVVQTSLESSPVAGSSS